MFALRLRQVPCFRSRSTAGLPVTSTLYLTHRNYAKKRDSDNLSYLKPKKGKHKPDEIVVEHNNITDQSLKFIPQSSMPHGAEYDKEEKSADAKMKASLNWLKEKARSVEARSSGRVSPDVLDGVKVLLEPSADGKAAPAEHALKEIATVGVKHGNTLVVTVFEEHMLRAVEKALYAAKLPGLTPQRTDARTILLPVSQPTMESRNGLLSGLQKQAEETRVAIRKVHQASQKHLKAIGFDHKSPAANDLTTLVNKRLEEIETILGQAKKAVTK